MQRAQDPQHDRLWLCDEDDPRRSRMEAFLSAGYEAAYGARLYHFLPHLVGIAEASRPRAAIGMAPGDGPLFLDVYLDRPGGELLEERLGRRIEPHEVCEIGNLCADQRGLGTMAIGTMASYLDGRGIGWALFTATRSLRQIFRRLGAELVELAPAAPERLGALRGAWGTYYDGDPVVVATRVSQVLEGCLARVGTDELIGTAYRYGLLDRERTGAAYDPGVMRAS